MTEEIRTQGKTAAKLDLFAERMAKLAGEISEQTIEEARFNHSEMPIDPLVWELRKLIHADEPQSRIQASTPPAEINLYKENTQRRASTAINQLADVAELEAHKALMEWAAKRKDNK